MQLSAAQTELLEFPFYLSKVVLTHKVDKNIVALDGVI